MELDFVIWLNSAVSSSEILTKIIVFCASQIQYVLLLTLVYLAFRSKSWAKITILALVSAGVARFGVKELILQFINRPRPFSVTTDIHSLVSTSSTEVFESFPSGHTIFFFALATAIYIHNKQWGIMFYIGATLIALARIVAGVHYPTDIIAGIILGTGTAFTINYFSNKYVFKVLNKKPTE